MIAPALRPDARSADPFSSFRAAIDGPDRLAELRRGLIGENMPIDGPFGPQPLVYADYTASGRALRQVEAFVMDEVLPFYANSHTEASFCGARMTRMRQAARAIIACLCGAGPEHAVIFSGTGATAGINRLVSLFGAGPDSRVILGPWEHHSNLLPWRESGAEVIELGEDPSGGPHREEFAAALAGAAPGQRVICAFSAASNITGEIADVTGLTRQAKASGARILWDYAGGGPYLPIAMTPAPDARIDAIVTSPHKFTGGPGASGVLILRRDAVARAVPSLPGGGTVRFVSPAGQDYSDSLESREEGGTPNVPGDLRAALAFLVKEAMGQSFLTTRQEALASRALARWQADSRIEELGPKDRPRLPILSFRIGDGNGGHVHHQLFTRMLSDRYGIQARGGCACAGPFVHRLLGIDAAQSARLRTAIFGGNEIVKPGFVRLNLSALMTDEKADFILDSVLELAQDAPALASGYTCDPARAIFSPLVSAA
ncbi:aminotransferase class V-fold PLP-dependent enzyme [Sinirhodobacter populi]|uniref:Aminotransferase class V-fold PLP-dependent enzyme n=1 Tax=Paenirhodobacter populi TaxID=2306993 RepID=A0A443IKU0_9RHOB|nr:aminotransferase class V-fold PLP-dependent enzyme [Sinirhodobacter populi]RWR05410.1 aminotransferase class V-fold PLP-dependent enzyme [Sinirhodobacter populi]RWR27658.1 aminotransferase class V-fold PLP-dependent enzyme [Sinirhodobacter populi]